MKAFEFEEIIHAPDLEVATPLIRSVLECSNGRLPANDSLERDAQTFLEILVEQGALIPPGAGSIKLLALALTHHLRNPSSSLAWLNIAIALRVMARTSPQDPAEKNFSRLSLALDACNQSILEDPAAIRPWTELGIIRYLLGQPENSLEAFDEGLRIQPEDVSLHLWSAIALEILGRNTEALKVIKAAQKCYCEKGGPADLGHLFESSDASAILRSAMSNALSSVEIGSEAY
jgi:tetratricopeptide (TPR) repeat protein